MPARPYKPKDKPSAEAGVLLVQRWILARLRHQTFYSLEDLNQAISGLLIELNNKPFQKKTGSRYSQFKEFEQSTLKPLPGKPYTYGEFKRLRVGFDYHIEVEKHYYSVPHLYARQEVDVRIGAHTIEVFAQGKRIASHERKQGPGTTTIALHMLPSHRRHQEWTPESCLEWALEVGPHTHAFMASILKNKAHLRQAYRFFLGLLKLSRFFGSQRLEKACERALFYGVYSYKTLANFLEKHLDQEPLIRLQEEPLPLEHKNIRGSHYYK
jgi:transposase